MGFYQSFFETYLDPLTASFITTQTQVVARAIEPAVVVLATFYIFVWGWLALTGRTDDLIWGGFKRMLMLFLVFGLGLRLSLYNELIVDTFLLSPGRLANAIASSAGSGAIPSGAAATAGNVLDTLYQAGSDVVGGLFDQGSFLNGNFGFYIVGAIVWVAMAAVTAYIAFLIGLSKVALTVVIALGPLFIAMLFFDATKRFFESWIATMSNYAIVSLVATIVGAWVVAIVKQYVDSAVASGSSILMLEGLQLALVAGFSGLLLRQVNSIAAGLASGVALSTFGLVSGTLSKTAGMTGRTGYLFGRGVIDGYKGRETTRWDPLRRSAGNLAGQKLASALGRSKGGSVSPDSAPGIPRERVMPPSRRIG